MAKDDAQSKETAQASANQLVTAKVEAVVGPFTSGMAAVIVPITGQAGIFKSAQRSPRWSSRERMTTCIASTAPRVTTLGTMPKVMHSRGQKRIAVAYDLRNRSFTQSWLDEFRTAAEGLGASVAAEVSYESSKDADFEGAVTKMLQSKPDGLLFISGALDVARLAQAARKLAPRLPIAASEWAATEQLIDLGGRSSRRPVDRTELRPRRRITSIQRIQRRLLQTVPTQPRIQLRFDLRCRHRCTHSLENRKPGSRESCRSTQWSVPGLQQEIVFDSNGDTIRKVYFTEIREGRYRRID